MSALIARWSGRGDSNSRHSAWEAEAPNGHEGIGRPIADIVPIDAGCLRTSCPSVSFHAPEFLALNSNSGLAGGCSYRKPCTPSETPVAADFLHRSTEMVLSKPGSRAGSADAQDN